MRLTGESVGSGVGTTLAERFWQWSRSGKEMTQHRYAIRDVHGSIVIAVGGVHAWWRWTIGEKVAQGEDGVGDVYGAVGVGVAAEEGGQGRYAPYVNEVVHQVVGVAIPVEVFALLPF